MTVLQFTIRALRQQNKVSTYDLRRAGIHPSLVKKIEQGSMNVTVPTLLKYLKACGVTIVAFKHNTM